MVSGCGSQHRITTFGLSLHDNRSGSGLTPQELGARNVRRRGVIVLIVILVLVARLIMRH